MKRTRAQRPSSARPSPQGLWQRARRLWLALFVVGMLSSHVGRLAHLLLVEHSVCEHGDLVEEGHHDAREGAATAARARDVGATVGAESTSAPHHDHCDVASILHRVDLDVVVGVDSALLAYLQPLHLTAGAETRLASPLDLAPKGSPPHA